MIHSYCLHHFKSFGALCLLTETLQVLRTYFNNNSTAAQQHRKCHSARTLAFLMAALHRRNQLLRLPCLQEVSLPYLKVSDEIYAYGSGCR